MSGTGPTNISVIIPVYKESPEILNVLILWLTHNSNDFIEWLICWGEGDPAATSTEVSSGKVRQIVAARGRSSQMNRGVDAAKGEILVFLHSDTQLASGWAEAVCQVIDSGAFVWGAFRPKLSGGGIILKTAELWGLFRSKFLGIPYGDQAIFCQKEVFVSLGGFDENVQFMEDVDLCRRLLKHGHRPVILPLSATTSARRWHSGRDIFQSVKNLLAIALYLFGVDRQVIQRFYGGS